MIRREFTISDSLQFAARDEYSVFEWARLYIDLHPAVASMDRTVAGQEDRLRYLGVIPWPQMTPGSIPGGPGAPGRDWAVDTAAHYGITSAVYQELAEDIQTGRLESKRRVYLDDRPGELDPTLCVLDAEPILDIAERRGDGGEIIQKLLIAREVRPGQKAGAQKPKELAWEIALAILEDEARRPPRGHGRLTTLAGTVNVELTKHGLQYKNDSVRKMIESSVREWERKHPHK